MSEKKYTGSCYIGVVGGEMENGLCRDSINAIQKRRYDEGPFFIRATKGYEARQQHLDNWYNKSGKPFLLLLDHDMIFPPDTLEILRSHKLPYVSGYYPRRTLAALPVWFDNQEPGVMPMRPMVSIPEDRALYPIGASGWGCILMHRDVVAAVKPLLKGEPEIIEDDMDVLPYDLKRIIQAIAEIKQAPDRSQKILQSEIRPLRGVKDAVGSDIRFPFFAKLAGFQLWGDTGVKCQHMTSYPVKYEDYIYKRAADIRNISLEINDSHQREIERLRKATEL